MPKSFDPIIIDNFNGAVVTSVDELKLELNQLQNGENIRFSKAGGFTNRSGYAEKSLEWFTGTNGMQGGLATETEIFFVNNGNLYVTDYDVTKAYLLESGLSTTASFNFFEYSGNVYMFNGIDDLRRINIATITTALNAGVSTSVVVSTGTGYKFPTTGNVLVASATGIDTIAVTAKSNDTLTITAATVDNNAAIGDKIYYILVIPTATANQKFKAGGEFKNRFLAAIPTGVVGSVFLPNVLLIGQAVGIASQIDLFHNFVAGTAKAVPIGDKGAITGLYITKTVAVITKKNAVFVINDYDSSGNPLIEPLSAAYGGAGIRSATQVGDQMVIFSGKEIKSLGEQIGLNNVLPSINPKFDDKIYTFLKDLDEDQSDSVLVFNPAQRLLKMWVNKNGQRICIVYDDKIDGFSFDYNKPCSFAVVYRGETFWGSSYEPKLFQDEISYDDDTSAISYKARTAAINAGSSRISKYYKTLYIKGKLGEGTTVEVDIYFDDVLVQTNILKADDLITLSNGTPIGRNTVGSSIIGTSDSASLAYNFETEILLKKRKNTSKMYLEFRCNGVGQIFEISTIEINGNYGAKFDKLIRK